MQHYLLLLGLLPRRIGFAWGVMRDARAAGLQGESSSRTRGGRREKLPELLLRVELCSLPGKVGLLSPAPIVADAHGRGTTDGEAVLERMSFGGSSVRKTLANQGRITLIYWWCTLCILRARRPQYQRLLPPLPAKAAQPAGA